MQLNQGLFPAENVNKLYINAHLCIYMRFLLMFDRYTLQSNTNSQKIIIL